MRSIMVLFLAINSLACTSIVVTGNDSQVVVDKHLHIPDKIKIDK